MAPITSTKPAPIVCRQPSPVRYQAAITAGILSVLIATTLVLATSCATATSQPNHPTPTAQAVERSRQVLALCDTALSGLDTWMMLDPAHRPAGIQTVTAIKQVAVQMEAFAAAMRVWNDASKGDTAKAQGLAQAKAALQAAQRIVVTLPIDPGARERITAVLQSIGDELVLIAMVLPR